MSYPGTIPTAFPYLREAASEQFDSLSDTEFAQVVGRTLGIPADFAENWLSNLGRTFQQAAPGIAQGALSGAMGGAALGPWGMLGGAVLGGLGGALGGSRGGAPAPAPAGPHPAAPPGAPAPGGAPAAGTLMQLLGNPTVQQALMSMVMGPRTGRESVEVGPRATPVPVAAFAELIREAADQALSQYEQVGGTDVAESMPEYLAEARDRGNDTGNALVRGVILAKLLEPTYVPAVPAVPAVPVAPVTYAPAAPAAPGAPSVPAAPATPAAPVGVGGFEPAPTYNTPDLGIGQPIQIPTQAEAIVRRQLAQHEFEESLDAIFELNGYAS